MSRRGFWDKLKKPIVGLSPMDGVTDAPFRYMVAKYSKRQGLSLTGVSVIFTEFVSVDAIEHANAGSVARIMQPFLYDEIERPVVAQVFGTEPELFYKAAVVVASLGFDGMDINMGCPAKKVEQKGSGAGLIRTPELAQDIVKISKQAMEDFAVGKIILEEVGLPEEVKEWVREHGSEKMKGKTLPVSVKTRIGVEKETAEEWMEALVEVEPAAITVHGRTLKQMYQGKADWEALGRACAIVKGRGGIFLGNGDVNSLEDVNEKMREYGVDGVLVGRAVLGNPGFFAGSEPDKSMRVKWMIEHARKYEEIFGEEQVFFPMRKHLAWYAKSFPGASEVRQRLMKCESARDVKKVLSDV